MKTISGISKETSSTIKLAKRIAFARQSARLSQQTLGSAIGLSDKAISAYERGRATPPLEKLQQIAEETKRSLNYFTDISSSKPTLEEKIETIEHELQEIKRLLKQNKK